MLRQVVNAFTKFNYEAPSKVEVRSYTERTKFTKDVWRLDEFKNQLVFFYDEHMVGHSGNKLLHEMRAVKRCVGFTHDLFSVWKFDPVALKNTYDFEFKNMTPVPLKLPAPKAPLARVKGQVWSMAPKHIYETLDNIKENGVKFQRRRVKLIIPFRTACSYDKLHRAPGPIECRILKAWMYQGIPEVWVDKLDGGYVSKPVTHFDELYAGDAGELFIGSYYYFTAAEAKEYECPF